jgi:hypothetical protein
MINSRVAITVRRFRWPAGCITSHTRDAQLSDHALETDVAAGTLKGSERPLVIYWSVRDCRLRFDPLRLRP